MYLATSSYSPMCRHLFATQMRLCLYSHASKKAWNAKVSLISLTINLFFIWIHPRYAFPNNRTSYIFHFTQPPQVFFPKKDLLHVCKHLFISLVFSSSWSGKYQGFITSSWKYFWNWNVDIFLENVLFFLTERKSFKIYCKYNFFWSYKSWRFKRVGRIDVSISWEFSSTHKSSLLILSPIYQLSWLYFSVKNTFLICNEINWRSFFITWNSILGKKYRVMIETRAISIFFMKFIENILI